MKKLLLFSLLISGIVYGQTDAVSDAASKTILDVDLEEVVVTSGVIDIAKARQTPIAVSRITAQEVALKVGNMEFPEILNKTPGVYATKQGGGYGDSRISLRGLINEIPLSSLTVNPLMTWKMVGCILVKLARTNRCDFWNSNSKRTRGF